MRRILITGAAGLIGSSLRQGLRGSFPHIRLADIMPIEADHAGEESLVADLHDMEAAHAATAGIDCVVHLAGVPREAPWEPILRNNIEATYNLFEAARRNGVRRIVFASSNHAVGFYRADRDVDAAMPVRPDSRYGVSKVFGEALGRLYADKHGMDVACLRIGSFRKRPENARQLATWISPRDLVALVRCCIEAPPYHFIVLYGVSANARARWRDEARRLVSFVPQDNAETFASAVTQPAGEGLANLFHGGDTCVQELTGDPEAID
jgi:uronate dehydrogenase